jgi:hypothetical protein
VAAIGGRLKDGERLRANLEWTAASIDMIVVVLYFEERSCETRVISSPDAGYCFFGRDRRPSWVGCGERDRGFAEKKDIMKG